MLFNSWEFIYLFLPPTLLIFLALRRFAPPLIGLLWLVAASLAFYGRWHAGYLVLLAASVGGNYLGAHWILRAGRFRGWVTGILIAANLLLLGYYKYTGLVLHTMNQLLDLGITVPKILLPLAISFFTFQQVSFLVEVHRGHIRQWPFTHYLLFVTFFPQLIAGPIVQYGEIAPQMGLSPRGRRLLINLAVGLTLFAMGLFKKVVLADGMIPYVKPLFDLAARGEAVSFLSAWGGVFAYSFQIYFDFSGYSDMAVGLARLFGFRLPVNFLSPYKAQNISEFWQRWHITLSRFLRHYLYIPLGGNRLGRVRQLGNLMLTMLLGGLWHGAGWTYVAWGGLHGLYLVLHHLLRGRMVVGGRLLTFLAVSVAWVFFRADHFAAALVILRAMAGWDGAVVLFEPGWLGALQGVHIALLLALCWLFPNANEIMGRYRPVLNLDPALKTPGPFGRTLRWRPTPIWALFALLTFCLAVIYMTTAHASEFIYFIF